MRLHVLHAGELGHVGRAGAPEHLVVTPAIPDFFPASLSTRNRKLLVPMAVPVVDGKINASSLASGEAPRHHSSSVSIEEGSQPLPSLPSVLVSTSVLLLSMRRLFCCLSFQRRANISPGRRPSTRNIRTMSRSRSPR